MGQGCPICGKLEASKKKTMSTLAFIEKAKEIHGDKYDYSKVDLEHKDDKGRICIVCPKHGEFWQTPHKHLLKKGYTVGGPIHDLKHHKASQKICTMANKYDYHKQKCTQS